MPDGFDVAILGATGFIGAAIATRLRSRGVGIRAVTAPRLEYTPATTPGAGDADVIDALAARVSGCHAVINAAGLAHPGAAASPRLYGANAVLPALVARACAVAAVERLVHVSSAAVQGTGRLDETPTVRPLSPYAHSKALGERLLLGVSEPAVIIYRPTSVHGPARRLTRRLTEFARSRLSCVAGDGTSPTPQVLVTDVATTVAHLALGRGAVPRIVLQPHGGLTTATLLRLLGGREPTRVPARVARGALGGAYLLAGGLPRGRAQARRLEMVLFGQRQEPGWLTGSGLVPELDVDAWRRLGDSFTRTPNGRTGDTQRQQLVEDL